MDFSVVGIEKASRVYNKQDRIAELNQKYPVKSVQGQEDRVNISQSGKRLLLESQNPNPPSAPPKTSSQVNITV